MQFTVNFPNSFENKNVKWSQEYCEETRTIKTTRTYNTSYTLLVHAITTYYCCEKSTVRSNDNKKNIILLIATININ